MECIWKTTQTPLSNKNASTGNADIPEHINHTDGFPSDILYHTQEETQWQK